MTGTLDTETQRLVDIAVAGAPKLTSDQIIELRRLLKPECHLSPIASIGRRAPARPDRRAA